MTASQSVDVFQDGIMVIIRLVGPILVLCMVVGIVTALLQAVTQIHEQSISFVLKLIVVIAILVMGGSFMLATLQDYTYELFAQMVA